MNAYIELKDYAKHLKINEGDILFISSDAKRLMWDAISNRIKPDFNQLIDSFIEAVGENGTVIFPTYNWNFCSGTTFDYHKTPCKTGTLGSLALQRPDFKRTRHPIYSFAVWGKYQEFLCGLENKDSFGLDSPFAFFREHNVKNYIIDVPLKNSFTFVHFVEEQSGVVRHRFVKDFCAGYIDHAGTESRRTYSMFVRDLELDVQTTIDPIEDDFRAAGVEQEFQINSSTIKLICLGDAYEILLKDILENRSRKLCTYIGQ